MRYGEIPGVGKPVSRIGQGTVMIGTKELEKSFALLDAVFEAGCNLFDTAHVYGGGDCERALGKWMAERGNRDRIVVIAKGAHHNQDRRRVTPFDIAADLHDSLARMQIEYVDLYILHRDDPEVPAKTIVEALNDHVKAGRIRAFGGSNWTHRRLEEANAYAAERGLQPFSVSSPNFSLAEQVKEPWPGCITISGDTGSAAREWYASSGMAVIPWSSLAGGFFSGRITRENRDTFDSYWERLAAECYGTEENFRRFDRAAELGRGKGATAAQIALAWVLGQPMNLFPLVGCNTGGEFRENAAALQIGLSPEELSYLQFG